MTAIEDEIKSKALLLGFQACGIAAARHLSAEEALFEEVIQEYDNGDMRYLAKDPSRRFDPARYLPGCRSVVVCLFYYPVADRKDDFYKTARYAVTQDYHVFIKDKMEALAGHLRQLSPAFDYKTTVDTAPVTEKNWAVKAGLGTMGKNTLFRGAQGSFCLIGTLLTTLALQPDPAGETAGCGDCVRCVEACPTRALTPYRLDWRRCLAYLTVTFKGEIPDYDQPQPWIYGCDICQEVCPHNPVENHPSEAALPPEYPCLGKEEWENITPVQFKNLYRGSPLGRCSFEKIKKQIDQSGRSLEKKPPFQDGGSCEI